MARVHDKPRSISETATGEHHSDDRDARASGEELEMNGLQPEDDGHESFNDANEETGLTHAERDAHLRRKRRRTRLDERVASSAGHAGDDEAERSLVRASMLRNMLTNAVLIGMWYSFSISISVYNKWMFSKDNLDFHFPLFTTSLHMVVQFTLASLVLYCFPQFRPKRPADSLGEYTTVHGGEEESSSSPSATGASRPSSAPLMSRWFYLTRIGPCGTATALDIGLGNFSLRFITLTFYTMCKSSVLAFVLLFAFLFRLEKPTWRLSVIIFFMTAGVVMMVAGETAFSVLGFVLVMSASFCSGFRWSLTQILLLRNPSTSNPFSSIFFLTPVMFAALFLLAVPIEGPANVLGGIQTLAASRGAVVGILILLFPGFLAFLMVAAEFALLQRSSVVTLSVCGIFKEVLTISAAGLVFGDELSPINISGLLVTILSIAAYNYLKYTKMKEEAEKSVHGMLKGDVNPSSAVAQVEEPGALMRNDLAIVTDADSLSRGSAVPGHASRSPIKQPHDLE